MTLQQNERRIHSRTIFFFVRKPEMAKSLQVASILVFFMLQHIKIFSCFIFVNTKPALLFMIPEKLLYYEAMPSTALT